MIKERVSEILDNDKCRVYFKFTEDFKAYATGSSGHEVCIQRQKVLIAQDPASVLTIENIKCAYGVEVQVKSEGERPYIIPVRPV